MKKLSVSSLTQLFFLMQFFSVACSAQDYSVVNNEVAEIASKKANTDAPKSKDFSNQLGKNIFDIFEDSEGTLWFGTGEYGVASYDGKTLSYYTADDGLCGKTVANIAEDKNGVLWFGTFSDMCRYDLKRDKDSRSVSFEGFEKDKDGVPILGYGWKRVQTDNDGNLWVNTHF